MESSSALQSTGTLFHTQEKRLTPSETGNNRNQCIWKDIQEPDTVVTNKLVSCAAGLGVCTVCCKHGTNGGGGEVDCVSAEEEEMEGEEVGN